MEPFPVWILTLIYPQIIKSFPKAKGKLFFTFDDGPNPSVTPEVLNILKEFNAKATFFCLGENVEKNPDLYKRILDEGHKTGNHGYNHINGFKHSTKEFIENVERADLIIQSDIYRPPYGRILPAQYRKLVKNFKVIFWDVIAYDFNENLQPEDCVKNVIGKTKEGSIIVFHDNNKSKIRVLKALPIVLAHFKNLGFTFESINSNNLLQGFVEKVK
jgi:peptidoglycan-N-acetylglucosamine deacetylase